MLQPINSKNYAKIRGWRNLPEVRSMMFTKHVISKEEHDAWWEKIRHDSTKKWLMYSVNDIDLGVVCFYDIDGVAKTAEWGFYLADDELFFTYKISKKRAWLDIEREAIEYAKNKLNIDRLFCEVFEENKAVIKLHEKSGFREISHTYTITGVKRFLLQFSQIKTHG